MKARMIPRYRNDKAHTIQISQLQKLHLNFPVTLVPILDQAVSQSFRISRDLALKWALYSHAHSQKGFLTVKELDSYTQSLECFLPWRRFTPQSTLLFPHNSKQHPVSQVCEVCRLDCHNNDGHGNMKAKHPFILQCSVWLNWKRKLWEVNY